MARTVRKKSQGKTVSEEGFRKRVRAEIAELKNRIAKLEDSDEDPEEDEDGEEEEEEEDGDDWL